MPFNKIVVPTDGSDYTKAAVHKAVELASITGASITAFFVIDQSVFGSVPVDSSVASIYDVMKDEGKNATKYVRECCEKAGVTINEQIVEGSPVKAIVAASRECDLIVMGTAGRTGFAKLIMGSIAERIIKHSRCPVMIVRNLEAVKQ